MTQSYWCAWWSALWREEKWRRLHTWTPKLTWSALLFHPHCLCCTPERGSNTHTWRWNHLLAAAPPWTTTEVMSKRYRSKNLRSPTLPAGGWMPMRQRQGVNIIFLEDLVILPKAPTHPHLRRHPIWTTWAWLLNQPEHSPEIERDDSI